MHRRKQQGGGLQHDGGITPAGLRCSPLASLAFGLAEPSGLLS